MANPTNTYLKAAKRVLYYVRRYTNLSISYRFRSTLDAPNTLDLYLAT